MTPIPKTVSEVLEQCCNCKGKGKVRINCHSTQSKDRLIPCPICQGTGENKQIGAKA